MQQRQSDLRQHGKPPTAVQPGEEYPAGFSPELRILQISHKHGLSHIGSCLTALPILLLCYTHKRDDDFVVLSSGHAGVALYATLEHLYGLDAEELWKTHGTHPNRQEYIPVSSGSLGHGFPVAIGLALAYPDIHVHCITTDGELREGSMWEAARIAVDLHVNNISLWVNANGYGAYGAVDTDKYIPQFQALGWGVLPLSVDELTKEYVRLPAEYPIVRMVDTSSIIAKLPFPGQDAHYAVMTDETYRQAVKLYE